MQVHQYNSNQPETLEFLARVRELVDGRGRRITVGELAPGSYELMTEYTRGQNRLHTAYAFDFLRNWPGVEGVAEILSRWREGQDDGWPSWAFSNHDVPRVVTRWGGAIGAPPGVAAPLFLSLLLCLRGTIFLYQGEELGLPEAEVPFEKLQDPWGIAGWPATKGRDGCRTPMPWKNAINGGFTRAKEPWLPVEVRHRPLAAETQDGLEQSMLVTARKLIALRRSSQALMRGGFNVVSATGSLLAFERQFENERLLCLFNMSGQPANRKVEGAPNVLWSSDAALAGGQVVMEPFGSAILKLA
jgi:alpha-glucosidase